MDKIKNAAIILLGMGEEYAEQILKNMSKAEVHKIMEVISTLDNVEEEDVILAIDEFLNKSDHTGIDIVSKEKIKNTLVSSLGIQGLENIDISKSRWIELIKNEPLTSVGETLKDEHPQILTAIIVILTQLGSSRATDIMRLQTPEMQTNIIRRISAITPISAYALEALSDFFDNELARSDRYGVVTVDGVDAAANLISNLDSEAERNIINDLSNSDKELADLIQDKLMPFEKLAYLDSKSLQLLLKEINADDMVMALKGANDHIRNTFMKNMSSKAAEILKDDLESKGPVKLANVIEAQKKIVQLAKKLSKEEKIILTGKSDSSVVF